MPVVKVPEKNSVIFVWLNNYAGVLLEDADQDPSY